LRAPTSRAETQFGRLILTTARFEKLLVSVLVRKAPPSVARRLVFYPLFALVTAITMSPGVFTLGLYLLVLPALTMGVIQWAFLVLPLIDWPLTAWRRTQRLELAGIWFAAALVIPLGFPVAANLLQEARAAAGRAGDASPAAPAAFNGPILISGDCGSECTRLVTGGTVERVLQAQHYGQGERYNRDWEDGHYSSAELRYASTYCDKDRRDKVFELREHPGWCLVQRTIERPAFGGVIHFEGYYGTNRNLGRRRIEVWICESRCRLVARQSEFKQRRFVVPLRIAYPGGGAYIDPEFERVAVQRGDADPARVIKAALGLEYRDGPPRLGENPSAAAREEAAFRGAEAERKAREESERLARLAESNRERAAGLAKIAREREILRQNRAARRRDCGMTERHGVFSAACRDR
jgi:hypothetical protein